MRGKTQSSNVVSSHASECGRSSFVQKLAIDSRSCSCSSVKPKWRRPELKSGLMTASAVAMKWTVALSTIGEQTATLRAMRRALLVLLVGSLALAPVAGAGLPRSFVGIYGDDAFFGTSSYRPAQFRMGARVGV